MLGIWKITKKPLSTLLFSLYNGNSLQVLCNKFLGKQHSQKMKSITIVHGTTTETVRLPPDCENGVTVHPAIRSKVPLGRKVRHGKSKKRKETRHNQKTTKPSKAVSKKKQTKSKTVVADEQQKKVSVRNVKQKNKIKKVIEYTSPLDADGKKDLVPGEVMHGVTTPETDPFGKVQNWLLKSQNCLPKSKSTPAGLKEQGPKSPQKRAVIKLRNDKNKSHSVGNLSSEKMRLQIVYKPPFKFSVKLRKPDKLCTVQQERGAIAKRKPPRTAVLIKTVSERKVKKPVKTLAANSSAVAATNAPDDVRDIPIDNIDANTHTVQSDLEVLLSENEFSCTNK